MSQTPATSVRHDHYAHGYAEPVMRAHSARTAQTCFAYGLDRLRPGMSVLDVGCGPGTITADIARLVAPGPVTGVDIEAASLEQAREHARNLGVTNIDFQVMSGYELAFPDGTFDLTHTHMVLHHTSDPAAVLREMRRVTRPGGIVAARETDIPAVTWYPDSAGLARWRELFAESIRLGGGEPAAGRRLLSWAHQAGLTDITCTAAATTYQAGESATWIATSWHDRLLGSAITEELTKAGSTTMDELASVAQAWLDWAAHPDAWLMMPASEILAVADGGQLN